MAEQYELKNELEIRTSDDLGPEFYSAFVAAQANIGPALADKINTYHNSKYADLQSVIEAVRPHFAENSLAVMQFTFTRTGSIDRSYREDELIEEGNRSRKVSRPQYFPDGQPMMETVSVIYVLVRTRLIHSSGQWLEQDLEIPVSMGTNPSQAVGNATTYARRYSLMAIAGVAPDEDDGQSLTEPEFQDLGRRPPAQTRQTNKPAGPTKPQNGKSRVESACERLRSSENLSTLRALFESSYRDLEKNGTDDDLAKLEGVKDEVKAELTRAEQPAAEDMPKDIPPEVKPEQEQPAAKSGRKSASRGINF